MFSCINTVVFCFAVKLGVIKSYRLIDRTAKNKERKRQKYRSYDKWRILFIYLNYNNQLFLLFVFWDLKTINKCNCTGVQVERKFLFLFFIRNIFQRTKPPEV